MFDSLEDLAFSRYKVRMVYTLSRKRLVVKGHKWRAALTLQAKTPSGIRSANLFQQTKVLSSVKQKTAWLKALHVNHKRLCHAAGMNEIPMLFFCHGQEQPDWDDIPAEFCTRDGDTLQKDADALDPEEYDWAKIEEDDDPYDP